MNNRIVLGAIDAQTRCSHYHNENDRIAIKFYCCNQYYACHLCHKEHGCGNTAVWPAAAFHQHAVLCGNCNTEMCVQAYLNCHAICPACGAQFNPGCSMHHSLYFETD